MGEQASPDVRSEDSQEAPLVSVIMPVFNAREWLPRAIATVQAQTYSNWELIIADDASTDGSRELIEEMASTDARIRMISLGRNVGAASARNAGLGVARGALIGFLDADDYWHPRKLALQVDQMRVTGARVTYAAYRRERVDGTLLSIVRPPSRVDYREMLRSNHIGNLTGMFDARLGKIEFMPIGHEDYAFWLEAVRRAEFATCVASTDPLASYTVREQSLSADKFRAATWQWHIYRRVEGLGLLRSSWLMASYVYHAVLKRMSNGA
jgi:teichuronic acid biosynthesis glycosyltransferase TuaG